MELASTLYFRHTSVYFAPILENMKKIKNLQNVIGFLIFPNFILKKLHRATISHNTSDYCIWAFTGLATVILIY